jgi:hypothetical protein
MLTKPFYICRRIIMVWPVAIELKFKENRTTGQPTTRCFSKALQDSKRRSNNWQEIKKEGLWNER